MKTYLQFLGIVLLSTLSYNTYAQGCNNGTSQIDLDANNARVRLPQGGNLWSDGTNGKYISPKLSDGLPEISAIYSGGLCSMAKKLSSCITLTSTKGNVYSRKIMK